MNILQMLPCITPCGGVRVLFDHANALIERGHSVTAASPQPGKPGWYALKAPVISWADARRRLWDCIVLSSPDTLLEVMRWGPRRNVLYFVQMMEFMFFAQGTQRRSEWLQSYWGIQEAGYRALTIASWLADALQGFGVTAPIIRNGVSSAFYPASDERDAAIVVDTDWRSPAKDTDRLAWSIARQLRDKYSVKLWGFGASRPREAGQLNRFEISPTVDTMREMYSHALFVLKASHYDGRSLIPLEAMACGTPTVRAIELGDDDLVDGENCLRTEYNYGALYQAAERMLRDLPLRKRLTANATEYGRQYLRWPPIIDELERHLACA